MTMWNSLSKALQYGEGSKFRRPGGALRNNRFRSVSFLFPMLSVCSLLMNGSMHLRRSRSVMNDIEKGPPATMLPKKPRTPEILFPADPEDDDSLNLQEFMVGPRKKRKPKTTTATAETSRRTTMEDSSAKRTKTITTAIKAKKIPSAHSTSETTMATKHTTSATGTTSSLTKKKYATFTKAKDEDKPRVKETKEYAAKLDTKISTTQKQKKEPKAVDKPKSSSVSSAALSTEPTLAACLLVRDDNDILPEWLAYHYHSLRMRRLIVAVDPNSETSPSVVLDAWKEHMDIDIWTDDLYMEKSFLETGMPPASFMENITKFGDITYEQNIAINAHRYRQKYFLGKCFEKFQQEGRSLVLHIDTDEYLVPNLFLREANKMEIKPASAPGAMMDFVQNLLDSDKDRIAYPCVTILRLLFGSVESKEDEWEPLPNDYDRKSFETIRWRYHGSLTDKKQQGYPKVLVDISKIPESFLKDKLLYSIHRPWTEFCRGHGESDYSRYRKYPITANHYLGSWERYNARNDTRRSREVYDERANLRDGKDGWLDGWLNGFVNDVGADNAAALLGQRYLNADAVATVA